VFRSEKYLEMSEDLDFNKFGTELILF